MTTLATARLLIGRTIVEFASNAFDDGRGGMAHDPIVELDNGATLRCVTEETDVGEYGTALMYSPSVDGACTGSALSHLRDVVAELDSLLENEWSEPGQTEHPSIVKARRRVDAARKFLEHATPTRRAR